MADNKIILSAKTVSDILYQIKNNQGLQIVGGCTAIKELPQKSLSIRKIPELSQITRHERFIDIGPAVTLGRILSLGEHRLPPVLYQAISSISNHFVRNMATIGGNICAPGQKMTLFAPLLAMDAMLRFRNKDRIENIPFSRFSGIRENEVLVNIRIPDEDYDIQIFRRTGPTHEINDNSASFCFLAKTEKSVLIKLKLAFAGNIILSNRQLENKLLGIKLPISENSIKEFLAQASTCYDEAAEGLSLNPVMKQQFLNLTEYSLQQLT